MLKRLRSWLLRTAKASPTNLRGRRVVVTGATPGSIGFETARILLSWGASVTITARSHPDAAAAALRAQLPATDGARLTALPLDLGEAESVAAFVEQYRLQNGERLDVLINNAGVHLDLLSQWKTPTLSADGFEIQWRINYLGTAHLTHLLLPLLQASARETGDARIVNVVSQLHTKGRNDGLLVPPAQYNSWTAYGLSKLALVHASFEIQRRYASSGVQAYCLHPGAVLTHIAAKGLAGNRWIETVRNALRPVESFFLLTPEEGAQTQVHCATQPRLQGGRYYRNCQPAIASPDAADTQVSAQLWDATTAWIQTLPRR